MAVIASQQSTCVRRSVGCVLVDEQKKVIGIGFNGVPSGLPHCNEKNPCPGATAPSGQKLDECFATHAEQNALLQCRDVQKIHTVYCTTAPCVTCTKLLMNTSAKRIVFLNEYPNMETPQRLWEAVGREWVHKPNGQWGEWVEPTVESRGFFDV